MDTIQSSVPPSVQPWSAETTVKNVGIEGVHAALKSVLNEASNYGQLNVPAKIINFVMHLVERSRRSSFEYCKDGITLRCDIRRSGIFGKRYTAHITASNKPQLTKN